MTKQAQNFTVYSGDDHEVTFTITNAAGNPQSLTGATAIKWEVFGVGAAIIQKSLGSGITLVNVNGTDDGVKVVLVPSDTASLDGEYEHELEAVDILGKTSTLLVGIMTVEKDLIV